MTKKTTTNTKDRFGLPLVGRYFHSIVDGKVKWQGMVLGRPEEGWYLLQLFSWLTGDKTNQCLMRIENMKDWLFYFSQEELLFSWEHGVAKNKMPQPESAPSEPRWQAPTPVELAELEALEIFSEARTRVSDRTKFRIESTQAPIEGGKPF